MAAHRAGKRRMESDIHKLITDGKHQVTMCESPQVLFVRFNGPPASLYENGVWNVRINLPDDYPYQPPTVTFLNKIYHPNVDAETGVVSNDAIAKHWTVRYHLTDLLQYTLPELLFQPVINLAVNKIASAIYTFAQEEYQDIVKEYIRQYAKH